MKTHHQIDARGLALAKHIVKLIDEDPLHEGLAKARQTCARWRRILPPSQQHCVVEWEEILSRPWTEIRQVLQDPSERGNQLRQNTPFCGVLSNQERWRIFREFRSDESRAA
ncbi:MAG: hypothetical protein QGH42_13610 [Kiritimatiellia bacterium]|nr:hypothetical protein [Kiritimatiellia bacterium]